METQYDAEDWAAATTLGRRLFNYNCRMSGRELNGWELLKVVTLQEGPGVKEKLYLWRSKAAGEREMIRIRIAEADHWRVAQQQLYTALSECMRPNIPRGTARLTKLGDVNFVARDSQSDIPAAILFTRGNMFISAANAGERNVNVSEIASRLDRALSESLEKGRAEKGEVRPRATKVITAKANESMVVIEKLPKAAPRGQWLKIIAPDGELSRKGDALIYASPKSGKKQVLIYAMRSI